MPYVSILSGLEPVVLAWAQVNIPSSYPVAPLLAEFDLPCFDAALVRTPLPGAIPHSLAPNDGACRADGAGLFIGPTLPMSPNNFRLQPRPCHTPKKVGNSSCIVLE